MLVKYCSKKSFAWRITSSFGLHVPGVLLNVLVPISEPMQFLLVQGTFCKYIYFDAITLWQ